MKEFRSLNENEQQQVTGGEADQYTKDYDMMYSILINCNYEYAERTVKKLYQNFECRLTEIEKQKIRDLYRSRFGHEIDA